MTLHIMEIDEKYAVHYDPTNNDKPIKITRYGEDHFEWGDGMFNFVTALFYALLEEKRKTDAGL